MLMMIIMIPLLIKFFAFHLPPDLLTRSLVKDRPILLHPLLCHFPEQQRDQLLAASEAIRRPSCYALNGGFFGGGREGGGGTPTKSP